MPGKSVAADGPGPGKADRRVGLRGGSARVLALLSADGRTTGLGEAFAHYGRIFKTLHLLQFIADEGYRRMISTRLNVQEARHRLARKIAFGNRGQMKS